MTLTTSEGHVLLTADVVGAEDGTQIAAPIAADTVVSETAPPTRAPNWTQRYVALLVGVDLMAALIAMLVCWAVRPTADSRSVMVLSWPADYWMLALVMTPVWLAAMAVGGAYRRRNASQGLGDYRLPVVTALRLAGAASILSFALNVHISRLLLVVYFPVLLVASLALRCGCRQVLSALRRRGFALRRMLLVGDEAIVAKFASHLRRSPHGYRLDGACITGEATIVGWGEDRIAVVGRPDDVVSVAQTRDVDTVLIVGHPHLETTTLQEISWRIERSGRTLLVGPDVVDLAGPRISVAAIGGLPLLHIGDPLIGIHRQTVKAWTG